MSDPPVLVEVVRNGRLESAHRGSLVLLSRSGEPDVSLGEPGAPIYPRSALKPLQASAMVGAGYPGDGSTLALAAASHNGEPGHLEVLQQMLEAAGITAGALRCPAALPYEPTAQRAWITAGRQPDPRCHGCSGKHAAMVTTCLARGWPPDTYLNPGHPLQRCIADGIEELAGESIAATGVDGCGAPAHAVSLLGLARSFATIATSPLPRPAGRVRAAMRASPFLIAGTGRAVTELTAEVDGLLCKDGAEGVCAAALADGRAFALKIADGADRAIAPVLSAALRYWGVDGEAVRRWSDVAVLGGGRPVGSISGSAQLSTLLRG